MVVQSNKRTASAAIYRASTYPFRSIRAPALYKDVMNALIRSMMGHLTIADSRYLLAQTSESYIQNYCNPQGLEPRTLEVDNANGRAVAHWIGDPDADAVILYCHGGAYTQPATKGNFRYLERLIKDMNDGQDGRSVSVLTLAYSLAPEAAYPTQLREAAVVLAHLVQSTGRSPSDVILAGDSAGAHLVLSLLSHVLHPHPDMLALKLERPLRGALLLSPWVSFATNWPSYTTNLTLDMLAPVSLRKSTAMFLGKTTTATLEADPGQVSGDAWTEACLNPSSWWEGMHQVVSDVFVWWGSHELLVDPLRELEEKFKTGWVEGGGESDRAVFLESAKEAHVAPIFEIMMPGAGKSDAQIEIEKWSRRRLQL